MVSGLYFSSDTPDEPRAPRPLRVLVVDDERDTVLMLMAILRDEGHEAKGVYGGRDALKVIEQFDPDAVILDIGMPGMNGWDVAREIRRRFQGERPMLIAVTGRYNLGADMMLSKLAGFKHHLAKPCDPNVLMKLLLQVTR